MSLANLPKAISLIPEVPELANQNENFTRSSGAGVWRPNGNFDNSLANDEKRWSYDPLTGVPQGRVFSGQWTNQLKDPRDLTTGNWVDGASGTSVSRSEVGIDGQNNTASNVTRG